jgi:hypothetical protein
MKHLASIRALATEKKNEPARAHGQNSQGEVAGTTAVAFLIALKMPYEPSNFMGVERIFLNVQKAMHKVSATRCLPSNPWQTERMFQAHIYA